MSDYYDPHPRILLEEPLALVGHPGSGVAAVARAVCSRTGLPFNDVARTSEAQAGRSRARVLLEDGAPGLRALESRALRQAVARRPCGVIALQSTVLADPALAAWLAEATRLVYLRRPAPVLLARIRERQAADPVAFPEFLAGLPVDPGALEEHLGPLEPGMTAAAGILEAGDQHSWAIADEILAGLDRWIGLRKSDRV